MSVKSLSLPFVLALLVFAALLSACGGDAPPDLVIPTVAATCLLYTSDAPAERSSVDFGGRRIIEKKKRKE